MFFVLLIVLLMFSLLTGICYLLLQLVSMLAKTSLTVEQSRGQKINKRMWAVSIVSAGLLTYFFLFTSPAKNYKTAYIHTTERGYSINLKGRRNLMMHDPVSIFLRKTYETHCLLKIPRNTGVIEAHEIMFMGAPEEQYQSGNISIDADEMKINLLDNGQEPSAWNGNYDLIKD
jgi:hypothetical protein